MKALRLLSVAQQVGLLFVTLFGLLVLASIAVGWIVNRRPHGDSDSQSCCATCRPADRVHPVYVFLAIPVATALAGDPERFLERNAQMFWITPFKPLQALVMGVSAGGAGTLGDLLMRALKKDAGVRWWGDTASVTGAVGLLDRVTPLCFAAPMFLDSVRCYLVSDGALFLQQTSRQSDSERLQVARSLRRQRRYRTGVAAQRLED